MNIETESAIQGKMCLWCLSLIHQKGFIYHSLHSKRCKPCPSYTRLQGLHGYALTCLSLSLCVCVCVFYSDFRSKNNVHIRKHVNIFLLCNPSWQVFLMIPRYKYVYLITVMIKSQD